MSDPLERNLEALIRSAGARPRAEDAKARFLGALAPRPTRWPLAAAAAFLLAAFASLFRSGEPLPAPDARRAGAGAVSEWIELRADAADAPLALKAKLPAGRARTMKLDGPSTLPERFVLFLAAHAEREQLDGARLRPVATLLWGGYAPVVRGKVTVELPWAAPAPLLLEARLDESHQTPEGRAAMKGAYPLRSWTFRAAAWTDAHMERLGPSFDEIELAAAELGALVKDVEKACASEARWKADGPKLRAAALELQRRIETLPARPLFSAAGDILFYSVRNLAGDMEYFSWKNGEFDGPVSYHADKQKLKTFRGDAWAFVALRRYAAEAREVAARELALWLVKDRRRGGRPDEDLLARPALAPWAERLRKGEALDVLEAEIRR
jgi:hypothetical protein